MPKTIYKLKDGTPIIVGSQSFSKGTVEVRVGTQVTELPMEQDSAGDVRFVVQGEFVYFRDL